MPKKKTDYAPHITPGEARPCTVAACREPGVYKAPVSPEKLHEYSWYCLEHIRERNQKWDFFADMTAAEIESFVKDAVTGHRPTWSRETLTRKQFDRLHDALYEFMEGGGSKPKKPMPPLAVKIRKALSLMDMDYPYGAKELKARYRNMVKKHHPDVNKGNKLSEEKFKSITAAYTALSEHLKNS